MNWRELVKANDDIEHAEISSFEDYQGNNVKVVKFYDYVYTDSQPFMIVQTNGRYKFPDFENIDKEYQPLIMKFINQGPIEWFDCPKLYNISGATFTNELGLIRFPAYAHYEENGITRFYVNPEADGDWLHDERYLFTRKQISMLKKWQPFSIQKAIDLEITENTSTN